MYGTSFFTFMPIFVRKRKLCSEFWAIHFSYLWWHRTSMNISKNHFQSFYLPLQDLKYRENYKITNDLCTMHSWKTHTDDHKYETGNTSLSFVRLVQPMYIFGFLGIHIYYESGKTFFGGDIWISMAIRLS